MPPRIDVISLNIWKLTMEGNQTNATNAILHLLWQAIWEDIWKRTVEKSQTNASSVINYASTRADVLRIYLKKHSGESRTNATFAIMHALIQDLLGGIWKTKRKQPVWLCIFLCKCFESALENAQWRKVKQMQPVRFCILSSKPFEDTFENTQWRKVKQLQRVWL